MNLIVYFIALLRGAIVCIKIPSALKYHKVFDEAVLLTSKITGEMVIGDKASATKLTCHILADGQEVPEIIRS